MKIQLTTKTLSEVAKGVVVVPVLENQALELSDPVVKQFISDNPKFGKLYETQLLYGQKHKFLLVGLGAKEKIDFQRLQNFAGVAARNQLFVSEELDFLLPELTNFELSRIVEAFTIGVEIASFDMASYYKSESEKPKLKNVLFLVEKADRGYSEGLKKGMILAESVNLARRLGDMPPNEMTPTYFLDLVKKIAKENKLSSVVLDEKKAKKVGMGAFVAVAKGSDEPSYLIALEYKGDPRSKDKWGLVGKGVTFDSGGISLKPGDGMHEMKYDMSGAAVVLGSILAIAKMGLKSNVVAVMAVTENLPSGKSVKPGEIVTSYSGKKVEVLNTDAEGRMILLDAISWAQKDFKASKLIDLATLTGAMVVALGDYITGVFGNNHDFAQKFIATGQKVGEKFWELPMDEDYDHMIKSDFADITNIGHSGSSPRAAGAITGAKFIQVGVEGDRPWLHLDIAGTAWDLKSRPYRGVGATGTGVKTLVELISIN